ncbi:hypothetical protein Q5752_005558 [Cryptotrichosporon argae]
MSTPASARTTDGRRLCQVIRLKPEAVDEYKRVHAAVWPGVLDALRAAHIVDYSIHYFAPLGVLVAHMRYVGADFDADMASIAASAVTREWWKLTDAMQESFVPGATGSAGGPGWWAPAEEVFRFEG